MSETVYSFVYDRVTADTAFHGIGTTELMLSLLAGIPPRDDWDGVEVFEGESPLEAGTVCIGTSGSGADDLQVALVEAIEKLGVKVLEVYEGGPEPRTRIAAARGGTWSNP
jgi:hypothetical protein